MKTELQNKQYKHLFFDLDHTLWDFETNARETLNDLFNLHALHTRGVESFDSFFKQYSFHNEKLWHRYTQGFIQQDELRWKRMWLTLLDFKITDEPLAHELAVSFLERLPFKTQLFPYAVETLSYLKNKNYELHLLTNGFTDVQLRKIQNSRIESFFKEVITSERAGSLKPQKEMFDFALQTCNTCKEECIMIGDNLDADIQGGMNAGIDTIFVNHIKAVPHIIPTYVVNSLDELRNIL